MTESSTTCPEKHKHQDITTAQGGTKGGQSCATVPNGSAGTKQVWGGSGNGESAGEPAPADGKEVTLQSLEEASAAGDDPRTCTLLQLLRQQLSEQSRKSWSAEVLKRLWSSAADVLRSNPCPEVKSRACQLLEVLGQNCKTCLEGDWEGMSQEGAPDAVIGILRQAPQDLTLLSAAVRAVLSFSGCLTCRSYYDRATQDMLGSKESVEVLISTILRLQEIASKNTPEAQASKVARRAIADGLQALHFLCLMNKGNVAILAANQGLRAVRTCIEDDGNELTVQEHGCMVLAELACRPDASDQEIIECVATVTNVARLQMQEKFIEVARAAVWSLTRIASNALHPYNHQQQDTWMAGLWQVWPIMQGQALHMIVDMMQSCQLKDDPLVKHCLDFIAVVGGDDGGCKGGLSSNLEGMSALSFAVSIVYHQVFLSAQDTRMQAVALRTLYSLLSNPKCLAVDIPLPRAIESIMKSMRNALRWRETTSKDIFCVECFGMGVIFKLLEPPVEMDSQDKHVAPKLLSQHILDIHAAIAYIARFIEEGGEKFNFDFKSLNLEEPVVEVSCCRYACHCCFLHEPCKGRDVLLAVEGSAVCLQCCGGDSINSTDHDGLMILHRLAQSGLSECLEMFISAAGDGIDFLKRTKCGLNALHLARASKNPECVSVLEKATEAAADAAQIALLKELAMEDSKQQKNPNGPGKKPKKKRTAQCTDGTDKKMISTEEIDTTKERDEEDKKRREEAEKIKRQLDEQYEKALEERRRQIEEQEKLMLQEAQQASLEDDRIRQQQEKQVQGEHGRYNHQQMLSQLQHLARKTPSDVGTQAAPQMPSSSSPQHHVHHHLDNHSSNLAPGAHAINVSTPPQSPQHGMDQSSQPNGCTIESQPMATSLQGNQSHDLHAQMSSTLAAMAASMASPAVDADLENMQTPSPPNRSGDLDTILGLVPPAQISGTSPPPMQHMQQNHIHSETEFNGISQSWHGPMPDESMAGMDVMHKPPPPANSWQSVYVDHQSGEVADHRVRESWHPDQDPPRMQDPCARPWEFNPVQDGPPLDLAAQHEAMMAGPVMEAMDVPPWASYPDRLGNGGEPLSSGMQVHPGYNLPNPSMIEGAHDPKIGSQPQPDGPPGWMLNGMSQAQGPGMENGGETGAPQEGEEDDHQILMHWLSSEITGLIENGTEKSDPMVANGPPPTSFPLGDLTTPDRPIRNLMPTLSNPPRYRSAAFTGASWGGEGYDVWDRPMSPMGGESPGGPGSFLRQSSMQQFGTPSRSPQVWVPKTLMRGADPRLASPGGVGGPWEGMSPGLLPDSFLETEDSKVPSKHLWLGNLNTRLPRSILKSIFEEYGSVEDVVTFPGRMYAFVNFVNCEDAQRAARELDMKEIPALTANRKLVIKFRPNRKALGRVGDLMPGVHPTEEQVPSLSPSRSAPSFQSWDSPTMGCTKSHMQMMERIRMRKGRPDYNPTWEEVEEEISIYEIEQASNEEMQLPEGKPSRHLWLGNISLRPSKTVLFSLFSRYGPVESVRIFPGKTFAFVNFQQATHAARAKEALDAEVVSAISGTKPLVVRFQREGSGPPAWFRVNNRRGFRLEDSPGQDRRGLHGMGPNMPSPGMSMSGMPSPGVGMSGMPSPGMNGPGMPSPGMPSPGMNGGMPSPAMNGGMPSPAMNGSGMPSPGMGPPGMGAPGMASPGMGHSQWQGARFEDGMPAPDDGAFQMDEAPILNLSNRLNPNNIHYDSQLASRYKRMAKGDKEALWADDRQQMVEEGQQVGGDMLSPLIHQTVREADSIGRLTRTLSAATLGRSPADFSKSPGDVPRSSAEFGKSPGDYDRSNPWAAGSQPMYRNSFGDGSKLGMYSQQQPEMYGDHLSPLPPIDRSRLYMTRRHHHTPSMPEFPTDFSAGSTASMRAGHARMTSEVPAGMQDSMMSPSQTNFADAPQAMTGSLGQFGSSMPPDVYASGPVSAPIGRGMSSGAMLVGQTPLETTNGLWG
ncbi:hypothetical protein BSKO_04072 [Bryopsis sp. KO-2023]|nr:hypothetical protein BSKO_04072 [Bryopsis sp. KO-2023]